jgi:threonyl-tRNA synthetase
VLQDRSGRSWQCGTLQLDFVMPERFGLDFVDARRKRQPMVMLHRAMLGSFERFVGVLLEHHRGKLPAWLAPESVRVLPIGRAHAAYAEEVVRSLRARDVRAELDAGQAPVGKRIFAVHAARIPFAVVVGAREAESRSVVVREGKEKRELALLDAVEEVAARCAPPPV